MNQTRHSDDPFVDMPAMPSPTRKPSVTSSSFQMGYPTAATFASTPYPDDATSSSPSSTPRPRLAVHTTAAATTHGTISATAPLLALQPPSPRSPPPSDRPCTPPKPFVELWTPDSPSAAHPGLPPPPALTYDPPLTRARTRSNEDAGSVYSASPFADTNSLYSSDGGYSPPRKHEAGRSRLALVLGPRPGSAGHERGSLEAGIGGGARGEGKAVVASEDLAARRRRGQKVKLGAWACALGLVLVLLVGLAVGVGVGVLNRGSGKTE
ncbi:hypothetical protein ACHAQA_002204 [Verticillium albo-atrum]